MSNTTTEKMLKNRELKNGVLNVIIRSLVSWDNHCAQGKIETDINTMIEGTIDSNILGYFDDFQFYYITNNFKSGGDFLESFYKANPNISTILNLILQYTVVPIRLILDGKADKTYKPLDYYYGIFNSSLEVLKRLVK